ncbi:hypothetical protein LTR08_001829 [Meristemomyces frigidus]|nr:hypothetical protein LTR08_001829 [Meristemomyces frigidus]
MTLGKFKRFQLDDYVMGCILCFYTALIPTINIVRFSSSNLLPPGFDVAGLSQQDVHKREYGSKLILVVEQCQIVSIWGAKACLILMYMRLTTLRREHIAIKLLAAYVAFGFCFMEIFYFGVWCRPFQAYWAVPTPSVQCDAATNHLITNAVLNLSSDCIMIAIGLPMFLKLKLPWRKKIPLIGIFSLGFFVILAAILNKIYSFSQPFGALWTYWYVRESSTALLVANLPFVWTLWRRISGSTSVVEISREVDSRSPETSRQASRLGVNTLNRSDGMEGRRKNNGMRSSQDPFQDVEDCPSEVEMHEQRRKASAMSFDDMLSDSNLEVVREEHISPYTHPKLYYGTQGLPELPKQKAVLNDGSEHKVVRRSSSPQTRSSGRTPVGSGCRQSLPSEKSEDSFL